MLNWAGKEEGKEDEEGKEEEEGEEEEIKEEEGEEEERCAVDGLYGLLYERERDLGSNLSPFKGAGFTGFCWEVDKG